MDEGKPWPFPSTWTPGPPPWLVGAIPCQCWPAARRSRHRTAGILPKRTCGVGGGQARGQLAGRCASAARYALSPAAARGRRHHHRRRTHVRLRRVHRELCGTVRRELRRDHGVVACSELSFTGAPRARHLLPRSRRDLVPRLQSVHSVAWRWLQAQAGRTHVLNDRRDRPRSPSVFCTKRRRHPIDLCGECTDGSRPRPPARLIVEVMCAASLGRNSGSDPRPRKETPAAKPYSVEGEAVGASLPGRSIAGAHAARRSACTSARLVAPRVGPNIPPPLGLFSHAGRRRAALVQDLALTNCAFCSTADEERLVPYCELGGWWVPPPAPTRVTASNVRRCMYTTSGAERGW